MKRVEQLKAEPEQAESQQLPTWEIQVAVGNDPSRHLEVLAQNKEKIATIIGKPIGNTRNPRTHIGATRETCEQLKKEGLIVSYSEPREMPQAAERISAATEPYVDPFDELWTGIFGK